MILQEGGSLQPGGSGGDSVDQEEDIFAMGSTHDDVDHVPIFVGSGVPEAVIVDMSRFEPLDAAVSEEDVLPSPAVRQ